MGFSRLARAGALALAGIALAIAFVLPAGQARAEAVTIEVCNQTGARIDVAVGGLPNDDGRWASVGWFQIDGGSCSTLSPLNMGASRYVYFYATQASTGLVWSGDTYFCVRSEAFFMGRTDGNDCVSTDGEWVGFFEQDIGLDYFGTVTIRN